MQELLEVRGLERQFGIHHALCGIDLDLGRGEVLGLLGPNGAGKTTCLQILTGNLMPTAGEIRVGGLDLVRFPKQAKRHIGYLPERPPLYPDMRIDEYLGYCARLHRVPKRRRAAAVDRAKNRCGLTDMGARPILKLSKGYRQRLGLAQAIIHAPDLVILDEPTEGLDPVQIRELRALIGSLAGDCGVILSSHVLSEVQAVCSRVLILRDGHVLHKARLGGAGDEPEAPRYILCLEAAPAPALLSDLDEVAAAEQLNDKRYRLTLRPGAAVAALSRRLVESGWGLAELTPDRGDLERVFFEVLGGGQTGAEEQP